jgi:hypothetical protein
MTPVTVHNRVGRASSEAGGTGEDGADHADNQVPPPDETARGQLLRLMASDAMRAAAERHFDVRLAFQNCHRVAVFRPAATQAPGRVHHRARPAPQPEPRTHQLLSRLLSQLLSRLLSRLLSQLLSQLLTRSLAAGRRRKLRVGRYASPSSSAAAWALARDAP